MGTGVQGRSRKAQGKIERKAPGTISLGWLEGTVGFYLRTAQEAGFQAFARRARGAGAQPWRFAILLLIDANPGVTQGELATALRRNTSSLTPALDELVRRGYVVRERSETDRRSYALRVTAKGRKTMLQLKESAIEYEREIDQLVGSANRAQFIRTLKRIADGLSRGEANRFSLRSSPKGQK